MSELADLPSPEPDPPPSPEPGPPQRSYRYVVFDASTGRIERSGGCTLSEIETRPLGEGEAALVYDVSDGDETPRGLDVTHYVTEAGVTPRPVVTVPGTEFVADGVDALTFTVPTGTAVFQDGAAAGIVNDGELVFASTMPAVYRLRLDPPWPWMPLEVEITAHAP